MAGTNGGNGEGEERMNDGWVKGCCSWWLLGIRCGAGGAMGFTVVMVGREEGEKEKRGMAVFTGGCSVFSGQRWPGVIVGSGLRLEIERGRWFRPELWLFVGEGGGGDGERDEGRGARARVWLAREEYREGATLC
ncbi:hypothetical protein HAX54_053501 [Datura stramonium]|uniref:Uncharacterized protein n=1 Tax=Datura stramonium TaxID=4076 RepID=A0ABS8WPM7_DATST|nr:hypothetical protein [Datura stramonium]